VDRGPVTVRGYAWSGNGQIETVEVSTDGGRNWAQAKIESEPSSQFWSTWSFDWRPHSAGNFILLCRATDSTGVVQPLENQWTSVGYCNNASQPVNVCIV
jgi:hypothetical protein